MTVNLMVIFIKRIKFGEVCYIMYDVLGKYIAVGF